MVDQDGAVSRRTLLLGGVGSATALTAGAAGWYAIPSGPRWRIKERLGLNPDPFVPRAPEGQVRIDQVTSSVLGRTGLFTAVPEGHGDGAGLPVLVVLHGSSARIADYRDFGFPRFVTAAARAGHPMVLAGTDPDVSGAYPDSLLVDELPVWLEERGFAADRRALWGWSRGGRSALAHVTTHAARWSALALFSPAVGPGDPLTTPGAAVADLPLGLWCGLSDAFLPGTRALAAGWPGGPDRVSTTAGGHTRQYWNDQTLAMLTWVGEQWDPAPDPAP